MSTPSEHPEPAATETPQTVSPASSPSEPATATGAAKPKVSPWCNAISLVLLVVLLVVGGLELTALFQFKNAVNRLNVALDANENDLLPQAEVEEILGKPADGPIVDGPPGKRSTTYTWKVRFALTC